MNVKLLKSDMQLLLNNKDVKIEKVSFSQINLNDEVAPSIGKVTVTVSHCINANTHADCIEALNEYLKKVNVSCSNVMVKIPQVLDDMKEVAVSKEPISVTMVDHTTECATDEVVNMVNQIADTPGTNDKIAIIKEHAGSIAFKNILRYTYADNLNYGFSETKLRELLQNESNTCTSGMITKWNSSIEMFEELANSNINDELRHSVITYLLMKPEHIRELLIKVLTKDLRCNISSKTINKAIPKLIPTWEVQPGYPLEKVKLKDNEWIALSLKLNGVRSTFFKGDFRSRQNKLMTGYDHIKADLEKLEQFTGYVFDGELVRNNVDNLPDNENFRLTTSIVNSDAAEKPEIQFVIFDMLPSDEFISMASNKTFKHRMVEMTTVKKAILKLKLNNIDVAPTYYNGTYHSQREQLLNEVDEAGLEGLMLLRDMPYKCKRHNGVLKCKKFKEGDFKIVGYEEGTGKNKGSLGSLLVEYKGNSVGVGSGYTDEQRTVFWKNRDEMIGQIITVKYKEETMDKKTKLPSLQFPIFVMMRPDKDEPNY